MTAKAFFHPLHHRLAVAIPLGLRVVTKGSTNLRFNYQDLEGILEPFGLCIDFKGWQKFHTSYVRLIKVKNSLITVKTRNSEYYFQAIDPIPDGILFQLSATDIVRVEDYLRLRG